jgi:hypothetical protein
MTDKFLPSRVYEAIWDSIHAGYSSALFNDTPAKVIDGFIDAGMLQPDIDRTVAENAVLEWRKENKGKVYP